MPNWVMNKDYNSKFVASTQFFRIAGWLNTFELHA